MSISKKEKKEKKMMNVNLSLNSAELELLNVSLRRNLMEIEKLANCQYLDQTARDRYRDQVDMVPRILEVMTSLQVQRIMYDCGIEKTVTA